MFSFVRNWKTVFQSGYKILHSHHQWMRVPIAPYHCQYLVFSVYQTLAILICMWWYLIVVLICISLMTYDVEHIFISLFAICISSLIRCLLRHLAHFLTGFFLFLQLGFKCSLYILDNSPWSDVSFANIFSQCSLSLYSLDSVFPREENFNFDKVQLINYLFLGSWVWSSPN